MKKIDTFVHLIVPLFILHLLEEIKTGFYKTDLSIQILSKYLNTTPEITFFVIQIILFVFLGILLFIIFSKKQIPFFLVLFLDIILLYEFLHTYEAIRIGGYTPGVITGTILGIMGLILLYITFRKKSI
jgi:tryptophan-rich sensory protein